MTLSEVHADVRHIFQRHTAEVGGHSDPTQRAVDVALMLGDLKARLDAILGNPEPDEPERSKAAPVDPRAALIEELRPHYESLRAILALHAGFDCNTEGTGLKRGNTHPAYQPIQTAIWLAKVIGQLEPYFGEPKEITWVPSFWK